MKTFEVYSHPAHGYEAVKSGFSWPAFFFTWIWAFSKGLVIHGFATIVVFATLFGLEKYYEGQRQPGAQVYMMLLQFGLACLLGIAGNTWRVDRLKKRGFHHIKTLEAQTAYAAITIVTNLQESSPQPSYSVSSQPKHSALPEIAVDSADTPLVEAKTKRCPQCGDAYSDAENFCAKDGSSLPASSAGALKEEQIFLDEGGVKISSSQFITAAGQTYTMSGISSVKLTRKKPSLGWPIFFIISGTLQLFVGSAALGGLILLSGILWLATGRTKYSLI